MRTVGRYCQMMIFIQNPVLPFVHRLLRREGPYIITPSSLFGTWSHQILERWFVFLWRQCLGCLTHLYLWVETLPYFLLANYCDNGLHECCIAHFYHVMNFFSLFMFTRLPNEINHLSAYKSVLNISFFSADLSTFCMDVNYAYAFLSLLCRSSYSGWTLLLMDCLQLQLVSINLMATSWQSSPAR